MPLVYSLLFSLIWKKFIQSNHEKLRGFQMSVYQNIASYTKVVKRWIIHICNILFQDPLFLLSLSSDHPTHSENLDIKTNWKIKHCVNIMLYEGPMALLDGI